RTLRLFPVRRLEIARFDARRGLLLGSDHAECTGGDAERDARFVVGHDVRTLADGGRGLDLGVEWGTPVERSGLDLDLALVLGVELVDQRLHADAVAATEEVPPHDGVFGE